MKIVKIDVMDGRGEIEVVVRNDIDADRIRNFTSDADNAFADQERWIKVRYMMTHERSGPNVGWTLGVLIPGDDQDTAIDEFTLPGSA